MVILFSIENVKHRIKLLNVAHSWNWVWDSIINAISFKCVHRNLLKHSLCSKLSVQARIIMLYIVVKPIPAIGQHVNHLSNLCFQWCRYLEILFICWKVIIYLFLNLISSENAQHSKIEQLTYWSSTIIYKYFSTV